MVVVLQGDTHTWALSSTDACLVAFADIAVASEDLSLALAGTRLYVVAPVVPLSVASAPCDVFAQRVQLRTLRRLHPDRALGTEHEDEG